MPGKDGHRRAAWGNLYREVAALTEGDLRAGESMDSRHVTITSHHAADMMGVHLHTASRYLAAGSAGGVLGTAVWTRTPAVRVPRNGAD